MDEPAGGRVQTVLQGVDRLLAANLLEAEVRAVAAREAVDQAAIGAALAHVEWVFPDRALTAEIESVLAAGRLRGADCWHLAVACYVAEQPSRLPFLTLDGPQTRVARALGFPVPLATPARGRR